jgi:hypothetical protein
MDKRSNLRPEALRLLQEYKEVILEYIGIDNYFLNGTPIAKEMRTRIDR